MIDVNGLPLQGMMDFDDDEEGAYMDDDDGSQFPHGSFRPGRVVWAKVCLPFSMCICRASLACLSHSRMLSSTAQVLPPAKVVRRRSVPREVGPPPGGPTEVHAHTPVVFFTPQGIPGEVAVGVDGAMAACMRAMRMGGARHANKLSSLILCGDERAIDYTSASSN